MFERECFYHSYYYQSQMKQNWEKKCKPKANSSYHSKSKDLMWAKSSATNLKWNKIIKLPWKSKNENAKKTAKRGPCPWLPFLGM